MISVRTSIYIAISVISILVFVVSCDTPLDTENAYHHFPLEQGNYWNYLSNNPGIYPDYKLSCEKKQEYNTGLIAWRLRREYENTYQYSYWARTGRYLREYSSIYGEYFIEYIEFPLDVGASWSSGTDGYTVICYGTETVTTSRDVFTDCYKIGYQDNEGLYHCYWYKPDFGFVKIGQGNSIDDISVFVVLNDFYIKGLD